MASEPNERLAEQKLTGRALARLRDAQDPKVTQAQVAEVLGMSTQAWQKYEAGERRFDPVKLQRALDAIGCDLAALEGEKARLTGRAIAASATWADPRRGDLVVPVWGAARAGGLGHEMPGIEEPVRVLNIAAVLGPGADALEVTGESMIPWAEPGEVVIYNRQRYPRRGYGCVVETQDGDLMVKLYEKTDGSTLFLRQLNPPEEIRVALKDVKGVYAVRMRGD